jgi:integrase
MSRKRRGRGEGSVYQRAVDGLWLASRSLGYDANGKRQRIVALGRTKKEAMDKLAFLVQEAERGPVAEAAQVSLSSYLTRWLEDRSSKGKVRATTAARYDQWIRKYLTPILGHLPVCKLVPGHVDELYCKMAEMGGSTDAQHKVGIMLGTALKRAVRLGYLAANPVAYLEDKPRPVREEIHPLDAAQAGRFLDAAKSDRLYPMYVLALDTGMRQGELFALAWDDFDWDSGTAQVRHTLQEIKGQLALKEVKTKKSRRRIKLTPSTVAVLHEHRKAQLVAGLAKAPVFCDRQGGYLRKSNVVRRSFKKILDRANETARSEAAKEGRGPDLLPEIRFHDLRHTCASLLLLDNVNAKIVSERLGHSKIAVTLDTYSHLLPTMQDVAAASLERLLHGQKAAMG